MTLKGIDWVGRKFGRLTVVGLEKLPGAGTVVVCKCSCGKEVRCRNHNLIRGSTKSCGCLWKEKITTHGKSRSRVYTIWKAMRSRCDTNPDSRSYEDYAGRGIKVCKRWACSFENFYADMGDPPAGYTLERIDNNGNYEPKNCKWATYKEQLNNTRATVLITAFGKTQSLMLWAEEYRLPYTTLKNRIFRARMKPENALCAPVYAQQRKQI